MERCSICRGRFKDNVCSRCGTDLTVLLSIEKQVESQLEQALYQLQVSNLEAAKLAIERSLQLKRSPFAVKLYNFINSIPLSKLQPENIQFNCRDKACLVSTTKQKLSSSTQREPIGGLRIVL
ncbi:MAG: hypothetical protein KAG43_04970 [Candidatus Marithrix sp.]|nr:hypothetical protein [Candidatus Marithrix sp.]